MNKSAIQRFAIQARKDLIDGVSQRAYQYGITKDGYGERNAVTVGGRALTSDEQRQRKELVDQIVSKGYTQVMEEVAYTWFNRFIALRFMEVNNYLPSHIRVFSDSTGAFKPEILNDVLHLDLPGLKLDKVAEYIENNQTEDLYRYLLLTQCNALNESLPRMFERMGGFTELLLPNNILKQDSVLGRMVTEIPEEDWTDQVQIIGWLYQYYNTELKDDTFALLKKNVKVTKERIPSATQLFTPDWIVRYMVENSLGRLWIEGHPNDELKSEWKYYLDEAEQKADVQAQLNAIRAEYSSMKPQDIKVIDPCMGSGHILVYAFDVLVQIYKTYGISERDAAKSILENNLYGLDIDDRAAQLAYFAVMMKARQYDRRIFSRGIQPHVYSIVESNGLDGSTVEYFANDNPKIKRDIRILIDELRDAKEYGSILNVSQVDFSALYARVEEIRDDISIFREIVLSSILPLIQVAEALAQKYEIVVTNPPYMGASNMNPRLANYIKENYAEYKADFFSVFLVRCSNMAIPAGKLGFFTPYVWMFIQSYERLRTLLCNSKTIENLIQFEYSAFEEATVPVCTFTFSNRNISKRGVYLKLTDFVGGMEVQRQKTLEAIGNHSCGYYYEQNAGNYAKIEGSPIAFWLSDSMYNVFSSGTPLEKFGPVRSGLQTSDNKRFLRLWFEVDFPNIAFDCSTHEESKDRAEKWYPHTKGGEYRKWFGNIDYVINWQHDGEELYAFASDLYGSPTRIIKSTELYFKPYISWSHTTSKKQFAVRNISPGMIFNVESPAMFPEKYSEYFMGLLNSKPATAVFQAKNQTFHFLAGDAAKMPVIFEPSDQIDALATGCIKLSQADWESFETSWGFSTHPLVQYRMAGAYAWGEGPIITKLSSAYKAWETICESRFCQLKANEEELNEIFIGIYGLQNELSPKVDEKDVTVRKADIQRDIRSLISYAVGCMFGRYSLDEAGLIYAGGEWDASKYRTIIPDRDNIIPICDDDYFDDDITGRFVKWVEVVYGEETLEENLKFIADALGGKGTPREVIRSYFINDFYSDHCSTYSVTGSGKRPIYWLFDSGKKNGFKALVYMHRYQSDLLARMRTDYVHEQQERYRTQLSHLAEAVDRASASEKVKLNKQIKKIQEQALEIQKYEEKIHHLADQNISIDLDDGVKHNYELFADVLAKLK